jgi:hypothetical protein
MESWTRTDWRPFWNCSASSIPEDKELSVATSAHSIHFLQGELRVAARGYWFTAGREMTKFGYSQHLTALDDGTPVYADTQVHNALRMAARWLDRLTGGMQKQLIGSLFGQEGNSDPGLFRVTDLSLTDESRKSWTSTRYIIKARIQQNKDHRTIQENMLGFHQLAWLDNLSLSAKLFLGPFPDAASLGRARELIDNATELVGSFGAFRSRGYGRGQMKCHWMQPEETILPDCPANLAPNIILCRIQALTHLRSKNVSPGRAQVLAGADWITADQFRGGFVRTFHMLAGRWPTPEEMETIRFSQFYPTGAGGELAYPAPVTTLRDETGTIHDNFDKRRDETNPTVMPQSKTTPLAGSSFVTNGSHIQVIERSIRRRMRNSLQDSFVTGDDGLFVQEFMPAGTTLGGTIRFLAPKSEFCRLAWCILENTSLLRLKGGVFKAQFSTVQSEEIKQKNSPRLLINPIPAVSISHGVGHIIMGVERKYNTMLRRSRRNKIVAKPGSVLFGESLSNVPKFFSITWGGFGKIINEITADCIFEDNCAHQKNIDIEISQELSRYQRGLLRGLLNPSMSVDLLKYTLNRQLVKYRYIKAKEDSNQQNNYGALFKIYEELQRILDQHGVEEMRSALYFGLHNCAVRIYNNKKRNYGTVGK